MTAAEILQRLQHGILFDGAMGTMLGAADDKTWEVPEELNLDDPDRVRGVHRAYAKAGADVITTNTFGGNRIRLERAGFADRVGEFNKSAARLAHEGGGDDILVAGDIGPTGEFMEPLGERSRDEFVAAFTEQAAALAAGGCDLILIETMSDIGETGAAIEAALTTGLPVIATMSFDTAGHTMMGVSPADAAVQLAGLGVAAVGANCGMGPDEMTPILEQMHAAAPDTPVLGQSNAGMPRIDGEHVHYDCTPAEMAAHAETWLAAGIQLIGSCCGSTPEHVGSLRAVLDRHQAANS